MKTISERPSTGSLSVHIDQKVLVEELQHSLHQTVFSSALRITPRRVSQVSQDLALTFFEYCDNPEEGSTKAYGRQLAREGLGPRSVLFMMEALRRVCTEKANPLVDLPDVAAKFALALVEGFIVGREEVLLEVQERTHRAHLSALARQQGESSQ